MPVHAPPLFHDVDLQIQVNSGLLKSESNPLHTMHIVEFMHYVQLLLHAKLIKVIFYIKRVILILKQ